MKNLPYLLLLPTVVIAAALVFVYLKMNDATPAQPFVPANMVQPSALNDDSSVAASLLQTPLAVAIAPSVTPQSLARSRSGDASLRDPVVVLVDTLAPSHTPSPSPTHTATATPSPNALDSTTNILVLGSDRRAGDGGWRTDVIMIVALDAVNRRAGVISIPRDIYLEEIPGYQPNRINVVDALGESGGRGGGPALLGAILAEKLDVRIDRYVRFEFDSFRELVDALGGVQITLDCPVADEIPEEDLLIDLSAGTHTLNGKEALAFVRTRRQGGDLARIGRQQQLLWAIREQMGRGENWLTRVPALYNALSDSVQTDVGLLQTVDLARVVMDLERENIHTFSLSAPDLIEPAWRAGMSIFLVDWAAAASEVHDVFEQSGEGVAGETGRRGMCP